MKKIKNESGSIIVEASIYFPLVLCTVMALLYLALFNMQEYLLMFQVQKTAAVAAREEAYLGYEQFGMGGGNEIDFSWGEDSVPSVTEVTAYYKAHHDSFKSLYREITGFFSGGSGSDYASRFADTVRESTIVVLGTISAPEVQIERGLLGTGVTVTITHSLPIPGVLRYLGYEGGTTIRAAAYSCSINPGEFVRNVDVACDLINYILKKFGLDEKFNVFLKKTNTVLNYIF